MALGMVLVVQSKRRMSLEVETTIMSSSFLREVYSYGDWEDIGIIYDEETFLFTI